MNTNIIRHAMIDINAKLYQSECAKKIQEAIQGVYKNTQNVIHIYATLNGGYHIILVDENETKVLVDNLNNDLDFYEKFELVYKIGVCDFDDAIKQFKLFNEDLSNEVSK